MSRAITCSDREICDIGSVVDEETEHSQEAKAYKRANQGKRNSIKIYNRLIDEIWCPMLPRPWWDVLIAIARYANDDGIVFPKNATIARQLGKNPRNVQRAISDLTKAGILSTVAEAKRGRAARRRISIPLERRSYKDYSRRKRPVPSTSQASLVGPAHSSAPMSQDRPAQGASHSDEWTGAVAIVGPAPRTDTITLREHSIDNQLDKFDSRSLEGGNVGEQRIDWVETSLSSASFQDNSAPELASEEIDWRTGEQCAVDDFSGEVSVQATRDDVADDVSVLDANDFFDELGESLSDEDFEAIDDSESPQSPFVHPVDEMADEPCDETTHCLRSPKDWSHMASELLAKVADDDNRMALQEQFEERVAIASYEGGASLSESLEIAYSDLVTACAAMEGN